MSLVKRRVAAALAIVGLASLVTFLQVEASHETDDQIGEQAVWNAATDDLSEIGKACKNTDPAEYNQCFIEQMGGYASSEAVAFSHFLATQKRPQVGYLAGIREAGLVDLGYVVYLGNAKSNHGWALMNGIPAVVNVDDLALLPRAAMEKDAQFLALRRNHPQLQLSVTDDQRRPDSLPQIEQLAEGGERFVIPYSLQEPCSGCAPVAHASFGFDFDGAGKFLGVRFLKIDDAQP
jgi:hypothetical protein